MVVWKIHHNGNIVKEELCEVVEVKRMSDSGGNYVDFLRLWAEVDLWACSTE